MLAMKQLLAAALATVLAMSFTGCTATNSPQATGPGSAASSALPATATEWAERVSQDTTTKIVTITEDNDPNNLIGRPNGYVDAAIIYDKRADCASLGASCGATIEVWADAVAAAARADMIAAMLEESPILGSEYHTVAGPVLLRVSGALKPSEASGYADAFTAVAGA